MVVSWTRLQRIENVPWIVDPHQIQIARSLLCTPYPAWYFRVRIQAEEICILPWTAAGVAQAGAIWQQWIACTLWRVMAPMPKGHLLNHTPVPSGMEQGPHLSFLPIVEPPCCGRWLPQHLEVNRRWLLCCGKCSTLQSIRSPTGHAPASVLSWTVFPPSHCFVSA